MKVLVTGGAGYVGSHLVVDLLTAGHDVVVVDDLSSGSLEAITRAQLISGRRCAVFQGSIADDRLMARALVGVDVVFHLAAFKQVGESMTRPERYFANNLGSMAALLESMQRAGVGQIVYSSTAAVYGADQDMPLREDAALRPTSPYGLTKVQGEQMLGWMVERRGWSAVSLRYFNPVGAHGSGMLGEPFECASSLVPRALMAVAYPEDPLTVFGTDYDTPDGTCLRDYVHIADLCQAHLVSLAALEAPGHRVFNVGTGRTFSVREVLAACERATGLRVASVDGRRRSGDVPVALADPTRMEQELGFRPARSLDDMVSSTWLWWLSNPYGYGRSGTWEVPFGPGRLANPLGAARVTPFVGQGPEKIIAG